MKRSPHQAAASADRPTPTRPRRSSPLSAAAAAGAVSLVLVAIAGCGSSSPAAPGASGGGHAAGPAATANVTPKSVLSVGASPQGEIATATINRRSGLSRARSRVAHGALPIKIIVGNPVHRPAPGTGGHAASDVRPAGKASAADAGAGAKGQANPCTLVTQSQARAYTGRPVGAPRLAPLGPTCVYHELGANAEVTVTVESAVFSKLRPHIRKLSRFTIADRPAYCGVYGSPVTYVLLSAPQVLSILAPCDVGAKFAAAALPKLGY